MILMTASTIKALCICLGEKVVKKWAKPSSLKRALRIDRRAQVSFEHVDKIEQWLNVQIFITGDHVRLPKTNAKHQQLLSIQIRKYSELYEGSFLKHCFCIQDAIINII